MQTTHKWIYTWNCQICKPSAKVTGRFNFAGFIFIPVIGICKNFLVFYAILLFNIFLILNEILVLCVVYHTLNVYMIQFMRVYLSINMILYLPMNTKISVYSDDLNIIRIIRIISVLLSRVGYPNNPESGCPLTSQVGGKNYSLVPIITGYLTKAGRNRVRKQRSCV